jgi:hypothetical protein
MRLARRICVWGFVFLVFWIAGCGLIGIVAVDGALHMQRHPVSYSGRNLAQAIASRDKATLAEVGIRAEDGSFLAAWLFQPTERNGDAVVLLHGQGDNRAGMLSNADLLLRHGYMVLLPDSRVHGESGGAIATYGVKEAVDLRRWFDWLELKERPRCVDGLGESMEAAQLLNSLAVEPGFCAVVAQSSFSDFRAAAYDRMGQEFGTGPWLGSTMLRPAVEIGLLYAKWKYGVDLNAASPIRSVGVSRTPVLLIHGLADKNLPPYHSERMKMANRSVELWEPRNAGHCGASEVAPEEYAQRVLAWFENHGGSSSGARID